MKVSVSILTDKYKEKDLIKEINSSDCDYVHLDIMDGVFVKNKSWTIGEILKLSKSITKPLDIHLMVKNPKKYIEAFCLLNASYFIFHIEAVKDPYEMINLIKSYGIKCGICLSPKTNIKDIFPYLKDVDQVLVMSVNPGSSGQSFIEKTLGKIEKLKEEINKNNYNCIISVDGGINGENALLVKEKGADMLVSASFIHEDVENNIKLLKNV